MPLKYLFLVAQKIFLALSVLVGIGTAVSFGEGVFGYGERYFGLAVIALFGSALFYGMSFAAGAAHKSLQHRRRDRS